MNILLAAVLCGGMTVIENCAKEPHIVDLANFLNAMGAKVSGAGTDVIKVRGVKRLGGGAYTIIPDQIEAGTYMAAAAAVGGNVPHRKYYSQAFGLYYREAARNGRARHGI